MRLSGFGKLHSPVERANGIDKTSGSILKRSDGQEAREYSEISNSN